jgi:hypothetical protein
MLQILEGSIVTGKSGKPMKVISLDGRGLILMTDTGVVKAKLSAILQVLTPSDFLIGDSRFERRCQQFIYAVGDRVTLLDKYQVRAADIGIVEAFTEQGIQIIWDNNSPHEQLAQPPQLWRTFQADELELVVGVASSNENRLYQQN